MFPGFYFPLRHWSEYDKILPYFPHESEYFTMKKIFALLLALTLTFSLCACMAEDNPGSSTPDSTAGSDPTHPPEETPCVHEPQIVHTQSSTCTQPGCVTSVCTLCGAEFANETPALGHSFDDATCMQARTCAACGMTDGDALGHRYVSGKCDRCGNEMPGYEETPSGCSHEYSLTGQAAPTCTAEGSFTYTCNKCGDTYTEAVNAKGHIYTDATCDKAKTCRVCGSTDGQPLGHSYTDGKCSSCGASDPAASTEVTYSVTVRSDKGTLIEGVTVSIFTTGTQPAAVDKTDSKGVATMVLMSSESYRIVLSGVPSGYSAKESYTFRSTRVNINLTSVSQTTPTDHSNGNYKVGSIMGDFTLTDTDGNSYTLSRLLQEKELVVLNFWFVNCGPCKAEFPYFESVYKEYSNVQLLTLNHIDTEAQIKALREQLGVTFPMIAESIGLQQGFDISAYPTTVFIDSSGRILKIQVGEYRSQEELEAVIDGFLK